MLFPEGSDVVTYRKITHNKVTTEQFEQCWSLFNSQYGIWGPQGPRPGLPVTMSKEALRRTFLSGDGTFLVLAIDGDANVLMGHAFARRFVVTCGGTEKDLQGEGVQGEGVQGEGVQGEGVQGNALWITQLVVGSKYRNRGIGTHLISTALDNKDVCVGLVSSNSYAVRALEKACRRAVGIEFAASCGQHILDSSGVAYLEGRTAVITNGCCKINTDFYVDHTEVNGITAGLLAGSHEEQTSAWHLGTINDGEEFLAMVDLRLYTVT
jgi:GNAT superfamily N-acetyltransferase